MSSSTSSPAAAPNGSTAPLTLRIGSRKSVLAMIQANLVRSWLLEHHPHAEITIVGMSTAGDADKVSALYLMGGSDKGLWTKELESALIDGQVDMIVHSLKDVQTTLPDGCTLGAIPLREDPRDAFVVKKGLDYKRLEDLPEGSVVGTSSVRRVAQLRRKFPKLVFADIRGNLDTRLSKLDSPTGPYTALILASAGLKRFSPAHASRITTPLSSPTLLHAVGQGALGIEIRTNDARVSSALAPLRHRESELATAAERALLRFLEGGCSVPVGVETTVTLQEGGRATLDFRASLTSLSGAQHVERAVRVEIASEEEAAEAGVQLGRELVEAGGWEILKEVDEMKSREEKEKREKREGGWREMPVEEAAQ